MRDFILTKQTAFILIITVLTSHILFFKQIHKRVYFAIILYEMSKILILYNHHVLSSLFPTKKFFLNYFRTKLTVTVDLKI